MPSVVYILKMFHFGVFLMMELTEIIAEIVEVTIIIYGDNVVRRFSRISRWQTGGNKINISEARAGCETFPVLDGKKKGRK